MIILRIVEIMTHVIFNGYGRRRYIRAAGAGTEFVINTLRTVFVDVGVVPEGEGGVWRDGVGGVRGFGTLGGRARIMEFVGAGVEGEDLWRERVDVSGRSILGMICEGERKGEREEYVHRWWIRRWWWKSGRRFERGRGGRVCRIGRRR